MAELTDIRESGPRAVRAPPRRLRREAASEAAAAAASCRHAAARPTPAGVFGGALYDEASGAERRREPALNASLGCGVPTAVADLHEGETVLDLGSGAGADVLISARAGRADREGDRPRHDRRDARARARQRRRGGRRERRVPQGLSRGAAARRRERRRRDLQLRDQSLRRQAHGAPRGRTGAAARRPVRRLRRDRRPRHGRRDPSRHGRVDGLRRGRADRDRVPRRASSAPASRRSRSARPTASTSTRPRRSSAPASRNGRERPAFSSTTPRRCTATGRTSNGTRGRSTSRPTRSNGRHARARADKGLVYWALSSLMVAEERITTKFAGLVMAAEQRGGGDASSPSQQVDEARHMQFYARFQDEVDRRARGDRRARRSARASSSDGSFAVIFDQALVSAHEPARRQPGRRGREGRVRHHLPRRDREHARPDRVRVHHATT